MLEGQAHGGQGHTWAGGPGLYKQISWAVSEERAVNRTPPWPLLQFPPWRPSVDYDLECGRKGNPFFSRLLLFLVFTTAIKIKLRHTHKHIHTYPLILPPSSKFAVNQYISASLKRRNLDYQEVWLPFSWASHGYLSSCLLYTSWAHMDKTFMPKGSEVAETEHLLK